MSDPWAFGWTQVLTLVGFVITIGIAVGGFRTFGRWKRERIEERRIEVALDALSIAYEARFEFEMIRSRNIRESEWSDIDSGKAEGGFEYAIARHRQGQRGPYAVLKRVEASEEFFVRLRKVEPKFMAIFGKETEAIFAVLYEAKQRVVSAAEMLFEECAIEHDPQDVETRERIRNLRVDVFASPGLPNAKDKVGQRIREFEKQIESLCRPIISEEFGAPPQIKLF